MEDELITILSSFEVPVYRQGSMSNDATYPPTFITFWNSDSPDHAYYDNDDYGTDWRYQVAVYSSDPSTTYSMISDIRSALKRAKWIVDGKGTDAPSDEETHTGRVIETIKMNF